MYCEEPFQLSFPSDDRENRGGSLPAYERRARDLPNQSEKTFPVLPWKEVFFLIWATTVSNLPHPALWNTFDATAFCIALNWYLLPWQPSRTSSFLELGLETTEHIMMFVDLVTRARVFLMKCSEISLHRACNPLKLNSSQERFSVEDDCECKLTYIWDKPCQERNDSLLKRVELILDFAKKGTLVLVALEMNAFCKSLAFLLR